MVREMNIVFVNSCPYMGGAEMWHLRTAVAFRQRGHVVNMLVRPGPLAERARKAGLPVTALPLSFDLDLYSFAKAFMLFKKLRPDVVLLNDQRECRNVAPAAALAGVPVRVQRKGWPFLKGSWRDRLVYRYAVKNVIANSEDIAALFRAKSGLPPGRIAVFANGFDLESFRPAKGPDEKKEQRKKWNADEAGFVLGTASRLVEQKGLPLLIDAVRLLLDKGIDARLLMAGEGELESELLSRAEQKGVLDRVRLVGRVDDMPSFLQGLDVFVFASLSEGRSNALAEALATGLPVVATDIPGNAELVRNEKNGLLVPPDDAQAFADAVKRVVEDCSLRENLGSEARRFALRELDQEKILARLEDHLRALIEEESKDRKEA